jgi:hypothetical protein
MQRTPGYILIILLLLSSNSWARIWYVKPDSTGQAINIQAGIDSCGSGDTVLVASGIFRGDGNRDLDFKGKPIVVLAESRYNTTITDSTVIDCDGSHENNHRGFYFHSGETNASILEGLVITNGFCFSGSGEITWGLDCEGNPIVVTSADQFDSLKIKLDCGEQHRGFRFRSEEAEAARLKKSVIPSGPSCLFEEEHAIDYRINEIARDLDSSRLIASDAGISGGGILCDSASCPTIKYNTIRNCWARIGGGICCNASSPIITHNDIDSNHASYYGCGIYCTSSSPLIAFNHIHDGYGDSPSGGGIGCRLSSPTINHNDIYNNSSYDLRWGPGIYCDSCSNVTISENNIYSNWGTNYGAGITIARSSASIIRDNDIWDHYEGAIGMSFSSAIIAGNNIHENSVWWCGGVVAIWGGVATIDGNHFYGNGDCAGLCPVSVLSIGNSRAIIRNNEISYSLSGGIECSGDSSVTIEDNTLADGGTCGGGDDPVNLGPIYCTSPVSIIGNTIRNNSRWGTSNASGGIFCSSSALIKDNIIVNNTSGSGIHCTGPSPSIINNTIVGNEAPRGSGILIDAESHPTLSGNIISNNRIANCEGCSNEGGGIYSESDSITVSCCDVFNNENGNYVGLEDQTGINGNFSADPIFCNVASGEYTLHKQSPCLPGNHPNGEDCGLIGALEQGCDYVATLLQEQHAEIVASAIEVRWILADVGERMHFFVLRAKMPDGEYEEIPNASIGRESVSFTFKDIDCKPGAVYQYRVDVSDEAGRRTLFETDPVSLPTLKFALYQNYPNPFNPSTEIRYSLPEKCRVRLEVYDISGRRIASLVDGVQASGFHPVVWNGVDERGSSVASGVYFCRLTAGKETISKKMVMLK